MCSVDRASCWARDDRRFLRYREGRVDRTIERRWISGASVEGGPSSKFISHLHLEPLSAHYKYIHWRVPNVTTFPTAMAPKNKNMRHPHVDPPFKHPSHPIQISPSEAQKSIANFLKKTSSKPHLHPDSFLSNTGIRFAVGTGPKGGIALHHLRRIDAGLRGEVLEKETPEQLEALFGPPVGDDVRLDGQISRSEEKLRKAKKRKREEIEDWVDSSSQVEEDEVNDVVKGYTYHHHEIESFAATPVHRPGYGGMEEEGQDPYEYDLQQRVWTKDPQRGEGGAVGSLVRQDGVVPEIVEHDEDGNVVLSKAGRKKAKKLRREGRKRELATANEKKRMGKAVEDDAIDDVDAKRAKEARKAELKARKEAEKQSNGMKAGSGDEDERKRAKAEKKKKKRQREVDGAQEESEDEDERERLRAEKKKRKKERKARKEKEGS